MNLAIKSQSLVMASILSTQHGLDATTKKQLRSMDPSMLRMLGKNPQLLKDRGLLRMMSKLSRLKGRLLGPRGRRRKMPASLRARQTNRFAELFGAVTGRIGKHMQQASGIDQSLQNRGVNNDVDWRQGATFEERLMLLMHKVAKKHESEMEQYMNELDGESGGGSKSGGVLGGLGKAIGGLFKFAAPILGTALGGPVGAMIGGAVGNAAGSALAGSSGTGGEKKSEADKQLLQMRLQESMKAMNRAFETASNIINAKHQTAKAGIRNISV